MRNAIVIRHCHLTGNHGELWTKTSKRQSCHRILIPIQTCCNWKLELSEPVYFSISPQPPFSQQAMSGGEFVCLAPAMGPPFLICLQLATIIIANVIKISSGPPWPPVNSRNTNEGTYIFAALPLYCSCIIRHVCKF